MTKIVIQCAGTKNENAGRLVSPDGRPVEFVASPERLDSRERIYARPDERRYDGITWREFLTLYNADGTNPQGLLPAYRLYKNDVYERLVDTCGAENVYILSAGWGLIGARFLTPYYNITFSQNARPEYRRRKSDTYRDFCMLPKVDDDAFVFFGGKDYVALFCALTKSVTGTRTVYFNAATPPDAPGCRLVQFNTRTKTNWHYECANRFIETV